MNHKKLFSKCIYSSLPCSHTSIQAGCRQVIEAYQQLGRDLPVNLRCVFEGMEESGSVGLPELVYSLATPNGAHH